MRHPDWRLHPRDLDRLTVAEFDTVVAIFESELQEG